MGECTPRQKLGQLQWQLRGELARAKANIQMSRIKLSEMLHISWGIENTEQSEGEKALVELEAAHVLIQGIEQKMDDLYTQISGRR